MKNSINKFEVNGQDIIIDDPRIIELDSKINLFGSNLFNSINKMNGYVYNYGNGAKVKNTLLERQCTEMFYILPNKTYYIKNKNLTGIILIFWDKNKKYLKNIYYNEYKYYYMTPDNAAFMAVFTSNEMLCDTMFIEDITDINYIKINFDTNIETTRKSIPYILRKNGLLVSYIINDEKSITEIFNTNYTSFNDTVWCLDSEWKQVIFNDELNKLNSNMNSNLLLIKDGSFINDAKYILPEWIDSYLINIYGAVSENAPFSYSKPIKLNSGDVLISYCRATKNVSIVSLTDENGSYYNSLVLGTNSDVKEYFKYETNTECYVSISCLTSLSNIFYIVNNNLNNNIHNIELTIDSIEKDKLIIKKSKNLFNPLKSEVGLLRLSGFDTNMTEYLTSDYISVKPNTNYVISCNSKIYCYGEYMNGLLYKVESPNKQIINITTTASANFIRISYNKVTTGIQVEEGSEKTTYESYNKPTLIYSDIEGRAVEIKSKQQFDIQYSDNLIIFETFTRDGYYKFTGEYSDDSSFKTSNQVVPIESETTYSHNLNFISLKYYDENMNAMSILYNPKSPFNTISGAKYVEISISNAMIANRTGVLIKGDTIPDNVKIGHFPIINTDTNTNSRVYANLADKTFVLNNRWKGCKYASLGDSVTYRNQWQNIVDFHLDTTHINFACSGMSVGGYAFHYTNSVADRLLTKDDFLDCQFIIICGYANNWAGDGSELGNIDDECIKISEYETEQFSTFDEYRRSITNQTFYAALKSTVEYIQLIAPHTRVVLSGQLPMDSSYNSNYDSNNIDLHRKNGKGYDSTKYSDAMKDVAEYYSLPYVDLARKSGVNNMNWLLYYSESDLVHPNFKNYTGGSDYPDSGMYKMARGIISVLETI